MYTWVSVCLWESEHVWVSVCTHCWLRSQQGGGSSRTAKRGPPLLLPLGTASENLHTHTMSWLLNKQAEPFQQGARCWYWPTLEGLRKDGEMTAIPCAPAVTAWWAWREIEGLKHSGTTHGSRMSTHMWNLMVITVLVISILSKCLICYSGTYLPCQYCCNFMWVLTFVIC